MAAVAGADAGAEVVKIETFGSYQKLILLVGILVLFADGFDAQIVSVLAPILGAEWGVPRPSFAPAFSANIFGLMTGALLITPLADTLSRKTITMACVGLFGLMSLFTTTVSSVQELIYIRFASGLALGGAMPCMIAATADFLPGRLRTRLVVLLSTAWSLGIAVCAFVTEPGPLVDRQLLLLSISLDVDRADDPVAIKDRQGEVAQYPLVGRHIGFEPVRIAEEKFEPLALDHQRIERREDVHEVGTGVIAAFKGFGCGPVLLLAGAVDSHLHQFALAHPRVDDLADVGFARCVEMADRIERDEALRT